MVRAALAIANKAAEEGEDELCSTTMDLSEMVHINPPILLSSSLTHIFSNTPSYTRECIIYTYA